MAEWVDFNELKQRVSITDVLEHYHLLETLRPVKGGEELIGPCPFHQGRSRDSFHVSLSKNAFNCMNQRCGKHGNILDMGAFLEGVDIRRAALLIAGWFPIGAKAAQSVKAAPEGRVLSPEPVNPLLTFELQNVDETHAYLKERGLKPEIIVYFGLGYYPGNRGRGYQKGRVVIPIHNEQGELVAYAGRWPGDPPEDEPKYKLPVNFGKSHVVFNLHRVNELARERGLILVEGYFGVFKLHQAGFPNTVALMGSSMSERQRKLLVAALGPARKITLLLDGDNDGRKCQEQCLRELSRQVFVKVMELDGGVQPDQLCENEIRHILAS